MTVGIGIIGTGFARRVQIPAFLTCENARVVSVASGTIENARATAVEFSIAHFTDDWRQTVDRPDIDLICITTPPRLHQEMTLASLERRKHVLCEKPMSMDVSEARAMTDAAVEANVLALIDHELRFQPGRRRAYTMLREGAIGKIRHAKYHFQAPYRGDPDAEWNWWSDEKQGGGALGAIGSHIIDSFHWFLGTEISHVFCQLHTHIKRRQDDRGSIRDVTSDDEAMLILRFAENEITGDATGLVSISMTEYPMYRNRIEFYGTEGAMAVENQGQILLAKRGDTDWRSIDVPLGRPIPGGLDTGFSRGFMEFAPEIVRSISGGITEIEHAATFEDGFKVQRALDAARRSNETGKTISVE